NQSRVARSSRDTSYKTSQVRETLISKTQQEPTTVEIAKEMGVPQEDIVFAIDAIQDPVSLFEPVYNDGGDPIYVMDQISDDVETDDKWDDDLSLKEGMHHLKEREKSTSTKR